MHQSPSIAATMLQQNPMSTKSTTTTVCTAAVVLAPISYHVQPPGTAARGSNAHIIFSARAIRNPNTRHYGTSCAKSKILTKAVAACEIVCFFSCFFVSPPRGKKNVFFVQKTPRPHSELPWASFYACEMVAPQERVTCINIAVCTTPSYRIIIKYLVLTASLLCTGIIIQSCERRSMRNTCFSKIKSANKHLRRATKLCDDTTDGGTSRTFWPFFS